MIGTIFAWVYVVGGVITFIFPLYAHIVLEGAKPPNPKTDELMGCVGVFAWIFVLGPAMAFVWPIALPLMIRDLNKELALLAARNYGHAQNIVAKSEPQHLSNSPKGFMHDVGSPLRGSNEVKGAHLPTEQQLRMSAFPNRFKKSAQHIEIHRRGLTPSQQKLLDRRVKCSSCKTVFDINPDTKFSNIGVHCPACNQNLVV